MDDTRCHILVVDDEQTNTAILGEILKAEYRISTAASGEEALRLAQGTPKPDLILLDAIMPGMDGYEVCRRLKGTPSTREVPVIFISAANDEAAERAAFDSGAVDYLVKPVNPEILLARVSRQIEILQPHRNLFRILIVDDVPANIELVANSLAAKRYRLFFATSGEQAVRQAEARLFDLILLDVVMDGMDGFETCRRIKALPAHRETPIIMLTGEGDAACVVRGFEAGAVDYVLKPFNEVELEVRVQTHLELRMKNEIIRREKEKSERLLLNILPRKVANELRECGTSDVQYFPEVTVLFADIVDFTKKGAALTPRLLINELNEIFTAFDETVERYGCERIKTMGDGYLAVCGMPSPNPDHASCMLAATRELREVIRRRNASIVPGEPRRAWDMRFGINSGDAVGGVVGVHKYIYDIFGDAVNTAARMEQLCEPMQINVSESTRAQVNGSFTFREREPVEVKGKGIMRMAYLQ